MNTSLHSLFLLVFLLVVNLVNSQSSLISNHFSNKNDVFHSEHAESRMLENHNLINVKVFSYNNFIESVHLDHDHSSELSLLDIISSDEGTDFNCSGGFCMTKSHFHKKGLTVKKQLFVYFMKMSC